MREPPAYEPAYDAQAQKPSPSWKRFQGGHVLPEVQLFDPDARTQHAVLTVESMTIHYDIVNDGCVPISPRVHSRDCRTLTRRF